MTYQLRPVNSNDHEWLVELHNDPVVLRNMTHPNPVALAEHMSWWRRVEGNPGQLRMVFTIDSVAAGFAKFYDIDRVNHNCVLGGDIHKDHRGKGHAKHMWGLMLELCFSRYNLHRVALTTAEYNDVGRHVYEKLGFTEEGRLHQSLYREGRFWDQVCMRLLKHEWSDRRMTPNFLSES